ncbi:hypothetical protein MML48_scaffold00022077 [Holotrichia oblita]|nr:hypothetical protein MML48_scaffold00022077 [Holotrichia oblita]
MDVKVNDTLEMKKPHPCGSFRMRVLRIGMDFKIKYKLKIAEQRYEEINEKLTDIEIINDQTKYRTLMKEHKALTPLIEKYREYRKAEEEYSEALQMLSDGGLDVDFKEIVQLQYDESKKLMQEREEELKILLLPKDPDDDRNVIIEIRGGAGGDEAALFVNSLFRMYSMYAQYKNWKIDIINSNPTELGGFKEISFSIEGEGAYAKMKYESGVHRVQRVPETEAQGRIHTSTITVAVLPEVEEVDVEINPSDIEKQTFRSSGAGGQHINKTESAIRLIHHPSGVVVECQEERSQHKNLDKAMKMLYTKSRPPDNPLIYHIAELDSLYDITENVPEIAFRLAGRFWPGPLTMIFQKKSIIPDQATCGLDTVAVRMPDNDIAFNEYVSNQIKNNLKKNVFALVYDLIDTPECAYAVYGKTGQEQARLLFAKLRELDEAGADIIFVRTPEKNGIGFAVYNRLFESGGF